MRAVGSVIMDTLTYLQLTFLLVLVIIGESVTRCLSDEEELFRVLFDEYNPSARPVMNSSRTVSVSIMFSLLHIKELDVRSQVLTTTGLLIMEWVDERLQWDPPSHGRLEELMVEARGLWRPEFAAINGAEKIYEDYNNFRAIIRHDGYVHWEPGGVFKTMCQIDITYYPFDEQVCELIFGAWSYHTSKMNLTSPISKINLDSYKINGEWEMIGTAAKRNEFFYECCPDERFSNVAFSVYMRRRHTFYIMNVILPSMLTSVLLLSIFFCTPGQKVQIGVVVLLSFRIFLLNVAGNIPKTSDHIPLLGIYLTCTMAITTLSMVLTVFVLNLHHINDKPVPPWVRKLVLTYLARMLGICIPNTASGKCQQPLGGPKRKNKKDRDSNRTRNHPLNHIIHRHASLRRLDADGSGDGGGGECTTVIEVHRESVPSSRLSMDERTPLTASLTASPRVDVVAMSRTPAAGATAAVTPPVGSLPNYVNNMAGGGETTDHGRDWRRVAEVFDRLFFWLFLLAILISTLVLFHPLTDAYLKRSPI